MIHIRGEGQAIRTGFNFYPLSNEGSFGFVFKLKGYQFMWRYSKMTKKWILQ
jgi:hypothetical protein